MVEVVVVAVLAQNPGDNAPRAAAEPLGRRKLVAGRWTATGSGAYVLGRQRETRTRQSASHLIEPVF